MINQFDTKNNFYFGELVRFEPGAQLPLLGMMPNGNSYNLVQGLAPDGHEAVKGTLYFMVFGNHLTVLQGDILTSRLERYLKWLLAETGLISAATGMVLAAEIELSDGTARLAEVDEITFRPHGLKASEIFQDTFENTSHQLTHREHGVEGMRTTEVLLAAGMDQADVNQLIEDKTDLEVTLQIKFKQGKNKKSVSLEKVGRIFRNVDPDDLTFFGPGGKQKHNQLVKLSFNDEILTNGSLFLTKDVRRSLFAAYRFFVQRGHIDP